MQFLADYGFKDIQLTIISLDSSKFTARVLRTSYFVLRTSYFVLRTSYFVLRTSYFVVKILEAFYINELNSSLNSQKYVYLPAEPLESVLPFINVSNRDTAVPVFIYGCSRTDLKRVLYVFSSKTALYSEFNIHWNTVDKILDVLGNKLYDYFTFS